ncbi:lipid-A-disaccharide kinase [Pseudarcicella hirudinis]|uniref:Tetraacyldisaccharide 4'-kinase n=1 Tax=Pseudarcicella hirudinis TaxID=1079859 RepID=A0A1I5RMU9_9BACT|nr:lipid-A-disaccharide kinase [Pseudarcicella hirudinis]
MGRIYKFLFSLAKLIIDSENKNYRTLKLLNFILFPFTILYGLITDVRNFLYNTGIYETTSVERVTINVGNITVGGTGKTPHVEYLIRLLSSHFQLATLSRGYGRKTKGFLMADDKAVAEEIGDEPLQFYRKFRGNLIVTVGEKRVEALRKLIAQKPETEVVLLDDAFQHRPLKPDLNILLVDFNRPIYKDYPFPAGRLREKRHGAKRADIIIVTKCPLKLDSKGREEVKNGLKFYINPESPVFFTSFAYDSPKSESGKIFTDDVLLLSGIANPEPFEQYAKEHFNVHEHLIFGDHHFFNENDVKQINTSFAAIKSAQKCILTTEKDMMRLKSVNGIDKDLLFFLPIKTFFLNEEGEKFDELILKFLNKHPLLKV